MVIPQRSLSSFQSDLIGANRVQWGGNTKHLSLATRCSSFPSTTVPSLLSRAVSQGGKTMKPLGYIPPVLVSVTASSPRPDILQGSNLVPRSGTCMPFTSCRSKFLKEEPCATNLSCVVRAALLVSAPVETKADFEKTESEHLYAVPGGVLTSTKIFILSLQTREKGRSPH